MLSSFDSLVNQLVKLVRIAEICWAASMLNHGAKGILCQALLSLFGANLGIVVTEMSASSHTMNMYRQMNIEQTGATKQRNGSIDTLKSSNRTLGQPTVLKKESALTNTLLR